MDFVGFASEIDLNHLDLALLLELLKGLGDGLVPFPALIAGKVEFCKVFNVQE